MREGRRRYWLRICIHFDVEHFSTFCLFQVRQRLLQEWQAERLRREEEKEEEERQVAASLSVFIF